MHDIFFCFFLGRCLFVESLVFKYSSRDSNRRKMWLIDWRIIEYIYSRIRILPGNRERYLSSFMFLWIDFFLFCFFTYREGLIIGLRFMYRVIEFLKGGMVVGIGMVWWAKISLCLGLLVIWYLLCLWCDVVWWSSVNVCGNCYRFSSSSWADWFVLVIYISFYGFDDVNLASYLGIGILENGLQESRKEFGL